MIPPIPPAPEVPIYRADVTTGSGTETTLPVTVDNDAGTASVDVNLQTMHFRTSYNTVYFRIATFHAVSVPNCQRI